MNTDIKLQRAVQWLGDRYVFHPDNRVKKGNYETHSNRVTDVAKTCAEFTRRNNERQNRD